MKYDYSNSFYWITAALAGVLFTVGSLNAAHAEKSKVSCVYVIEGGENKQALTSAQFPEVGLANKLAILNNCKVVDPIMSMVGEHLEELFLRTPVNEREALAVSLMLIYSQFGDSADVLLEEKVVEPYAALVRRTKRKSYPGWLIIAVTNPTRWINQYMEARGDEKLNADKLKYWNIAMHLSNDMSADKFMKNVVREYPNVRNVYGLVGQYHLSMLREKAEVKTQSEFIWEYEIPVQEESVNVVLVGGQHGDIRYFEMLREIVRKDGGRVGFNF